MVEYGSLAAKLDQTTRNASNGETYHLSDPTTALTTIPNHSDFAGQFETADQAPPASTEAPVEESTFPRLLPVPRRRGSSTLRGATLLEALEKRQDVVLEQLDNLHASIEAVLKEAQPQRAAAQ